MPRSSGGTGEQPTIAPGCARKDTRSLSRNELDPYFSATKIARLLDKVPGARERGERGELAFGTVDSFLIWRLTGGSSHVTDATNASRKLLFDIRRGRWDEDLLTQLRGLGHFSRSRVKEINTLTERVFTTRRVAAGARRRRF